MWQLRSPNSVVCVINSYVLPDVSNNDPILTHEPGQSGHLLCRGVRLFRKVVGARLLIWPGNPRFFRTWPLTERRWGST